MYSFKVKMLPYHTYDTNSLLVTD